jgi:hypothetical protein
MRWKVRDHNALAVVQYFMPEFTLIDLATL